jgi:signal peptidase I
MAYEPFNIPSGSMVPTLLVGDYLFVSKLSYGYSKYSLPLATWFPDSWTGRLFQSDPERGDVAVFALPRDPSIDYIKRVIGLPGDRIQMRGGRLYINGTIVPRRADGDVVYDDGLRGFVRMRKYIETLPNGREHVIIERSDGEKLDDTREFVVPAGQYFMMGDNRDHSADSREGGWFVPVRNFVGRADVIFFSIDDSASFWEVWKWPSAIRFSRFFNGID